MREFKDHDSNELHTTRSGCAKRVKLAFFNTLHHMFKYYLHSYLKWEKYWSNNFAYDIISFMAELLSVYPLMEKVSWIIYVVICYIICFLFLFTIIFILFSRYFSSRFSGPTVWIMKFLTLWINLLITVLYVPTAGILLSLFDCKNTPGGIVHSFDSSIKCYKGEHWAHIIVCSVFLVLHLIASTIFASFFYEMRFKSGSNTSKLNSRYDMGYILYQSGLLIVNLVAKLNDKVWLICVYMLSGSLFLYIQCGLQKRFFTHIMEKIFRCYSLLQIWLGFAFTYAVIFQESDGIVLLLVGGLFILLGICLKRNSNWEDELRDNKILRSENDAVQKILVYKELMLKNDKEENEFEMIATGYIVYHCSHCSKEKCELKSFMKHIGKEPIFSPEDGSKIQESRRMLISHCNELFREEIAQFPESKLLRLLYILYLTTGGENKCLALEELVVLEYFDPSLQEQAIIYHLRESIKDEIMNNKSDKHKYLRVTSIIAYETYNNFFKEKTKRATLLYNQFWKLLLEDHPDLTKLRSAGFTIQTVLKSAKSHWILMQEINPDESSALNYYLSFAEKVLNDKELALELAEKLEKANIKRFNVDKRHIQAANSCDVQAISPEGDPCICVSGHCNKIGIITNCNSSLCAVFGYKKKDLIGKDISVLIPDLFVELHKAILQGQIQRQGAEEERKTEFSIFGKLKSGYIMSMWLNILASPTILNESNFIALLRIDKAVSNSDIMELLLDKSKVVVEVNSKAIPLLGLEQEQVKKLHISLSDLCPEIVDTEIIKKTLMTTELCIPNSKKSITVNCFIEPLMLRNSNLIGYSMKLQVLVEKNILKQRAYEAPSEFEFTYDHVQNKYVRDYNSDGISKIYTPKLNDYQRLLSKRNFSKNSSSKANVLQTTNDKFNIIKDICENISEFASEFYQLLLTRLKFIDKSAENFTPVGSLASCLTKEFIDYGKNVRTIRLIDGAYLDVKFQLNSKEILLKDADQDLIIRQSNTSGKKDKKSNLLLSMNIKGKESLENILTQAKNKELGIAYISSYTVSLLFFGFAIAIYIILTQFFTSVSDRIQLVDSSYQRMIYEQAVMYHMNSILLVVEERYTAYETYYNLNKEEYFDIVKKNLTTETVNLYLTHKQLTKATVKLSDYAKYSSYSTDRDLELGIRAATDYIIYKKFSLSEAMLKMISAVFVVSNKTLSANLPTDENMMFVLDNGDNQIILATDSSATFYSDQYEEFIRKGQVLVTVIFGCMIGLAVLIVILLLILVYRMESSKMKIYLLLLEAPIEVLKTLQKRAEQFQASFDGKERDFELNENIGELENSSASLSLLNFSEFDIQKDREFKNKPRFFLLVTICLISITLVSLSFYICEYALYERYRSRGYKVVPAFSEVIKVAAPLYILINSLRHYIYNESTIVGNMSAHAYMIKCMTNGYDHLKTIEDFKIILKDVITAEQIDNIEYLLFNNICSHISFFATIEDCEGFARGLTQQGLVPLIANYLLNIRVAITEYEMAKLDDNVVYDFFNSENLYRCYIILNFMLRPMFRSLKDSFVVGIRATFTDISTIRLGILIGYLIIFIILDFILLGSFLNMMYKSDIRTRKMIALFPLEVIIKIRHMYDHLERNALQIH